MKLSVALATFNEERLIKKCLEAIYDLADEIVIVDGTSTDSTLAIVKKLDRDNKIKITIKDNPPMFHINKQVAIEKCKGEWILQLDADEIVSKELKEEIKDVVNSKHETLNSKQIQNHNDQNQLSTVNSPMSNSSDIVAYWIPRLNYFLGTPLTKGGQYPDPTIRLYKNGVARFPCKTTHEQVEITPPDGVAQKAETSQAGSLILDLHYDQQKDKTYIGHLQKPLLHYPWPSIKDYFNKALIRYSTHEAIRLHDLGMKPSFWGGVKFLVILPIVWFLKTYFRHRGYVDGFAGFIFSLFSSLRYWITYVHLVELESQK